ncbi:hypothetical protein LI065_16735 [Butyricimonas synergistica]|nr:hypothetical protein [Butyricimonas synergistica]
MKSITPCLDFRFHTFANAIFNSKFKETPPALRATSSINRGGAGIPPLMQEKQPATCRRQMQPVTCNSPQANQ